MPDYFTLFEMDRTFHVDAERLQSTFYRLQSAAHPDRHVAEEHEQMAQALESSSGINKAYQVLRDRFRRAKYLLSLYDFSVKQQKAVPPALLMTVMESQEKLAEIEQQTSSEAKEKLIAELDPLLSDLEFQVAAAEAKIDTVAATWDGHPHPDHPTELTEEARAELTKITQLLAERAYIDTLYKSILAVKHGDSAIIRH